jgi:RNA polymerase sigma factor (sigma-70 family)
MQFQSDAQLLRDYAERGTEAAFTELVRRHTNLVYSAAMRQVETAAVAAEITQNVFVRLAQGAKALVPRLVPESSLAGWLCRSAGNLARNHRRDEFRRSTREKLAMEQLITAPDAAPNWEQLRRVLDDAMSELNETDYDALVLRFYQNQDFRAVGAAIGVSDDTAQKRVTRALDKLRDLLAQRGIRTTAATLGVVISANAVQSAPVGLALTISAAALAGTTATTSTLIAATTKTIAMTTLQKTLVTATVAILAAAGIYEARQAAQLREQNQTLQQQQAASAEQIEQLQNNLADATNRLANAPGAEPGLKSNPNPNELLKLRGEVGVLRRQKSELETALASLRNTQPQNSDQNPEPPAPALPADYPKTGDAATMAIFDAWGKGDWDSFFTNFSHPYVTREQYDQLFNERFKNALAGMEVESIGQPTNGWSEGHYFVPYKITWRNGEKKEGRLSIKQDPRTKRWYFDGGF